MSEPGQALLPSIICGRLSIQIVMSEELQVIGTTVSFVDIADLFWYIKCGEIVTLKGTYGQQLLNPLVAAQNFEYSM